MNVLFCAATQKELECLPPILRKEAHTLVTGVGIPLTLVRLQDALYHKFKRPPGVTHSLPPITVVQVGIAGAFPESVLEMGQVVQVSQDVYGDLGFEIPTHTEDQEPFLPLEATQFAEGYHQPYSFKLLPNSNLASVRAITVQTCTGTESTAHQRRKIFGADIETMEGAPVVQILQTTDRAFQIRSISNRVGLRDINTKKIQIALNSLTEFCEHYSWENLWKS
jgi:hypothetical protein